MKMAGGIIGARSSKFPKRLLPILLAAYGAGLSFTTPLAFRAPAIPPAAQAIYSCFLSFFL